MKAEIQRTERISFRLRSFEREMIERAADSERITLTEWVRAQLIRAALRRRDAGDAPGHLAAR